MLMKEKDFNKKSDYIFDGAVSLKDLNSRFGAEIRVSQYGFANNVYEKNIDYAVHLIVSSLALNNSGDFKNKLSTGVLSLESIAISLNMEMGNRKSRSVSNVRESVNRLVENGLFELEYINDTNKDLFIVKQSTFSFSGNDVANYFYFSRDEYVKLIKINGNNDRFNAIAIAMSIFSEINYLKKDKYWDANKEYGKVFSESSYNNANVLQRTFTSKSVNELADKSGMSLRSFRRNLDMLIHNKVIKAVKVQLIYKGNNNHGGWVNYYCHYEEMSFLKAYLSNLIQSRSSNTKEQILDVDITEAEKQMRK